MIQIDIEMPSCCADCPFFDDRWDYPTCQVNDHSRGYNFNIRENRMPDCPLQNVNDSNPCSGCQEFDCYGCEHANEVTE